MFNEEDSESDLYKYKRVETDKVVQWYKNNILVEVHPVLTLKSDLEHKVHIIHEEDNYIILLEELNKEYYLECAAIFPDVFDVLITLPNPARG
jgi:hypothetical protein